MTRRYLLIALGGMAGASTRWAVGTLVDADGFPWAVFLVNVCGCAVLGALLAGEYRHPRARLWFHDFGAIGFCGGLTTMSSFATGVIDLADHNEPVTAVTYVAASLLAGFTALIVGAVVARRLRALVLPIEEAP